ncbi:unnamed protein product [Fraxinus pennsylvanica]|uniref:Uncharacterized protein n=1 Tax=Fraxinus pennsylvanica TaxID=56036 RepID=A0AAD2DUM1_9LAMI|nr:unnamed protein product [Fraxinus pennsylvanica]
MDKGKVKGKNTLGESSGSKLNPNAQPFSPIVDAPRVKRTLFMKFFITFPTISKQEIHDYFTRRFGNNCIESLYVPKQNERDSKLGIITFSISLFPYVIWDDGKRSYC